MIEEVQKERTKIMSPNPFMQKKKKKPTVKKGKKGTSKAKMTKKMAPYGIGADMSGSMNY